MIHKRNKERINKDNREEKKEIDPYDRIVERAHNEIQGVRSVYKWLAGILGIIFVFGIGVATFLTYNTVSDMRSDFREMKSDIKDELADVEKKVINRIDEEFKTEKIQSLIEDKAKEYTERAAEQFIAAEVNEVITPFRTEMEKTLQKSNQELEKLTLKNNYLLTVINAQNDDRKAFDQLLIWYKDKTFLLSPQALKAWANIVEKHSQPLFKKLPSFPWEEGTDPSKLNLSALKRKYESTHWYLKPNLIKYIWERKDFSKYERMEFLADVLKNDDSLRAVEYAGRYFGKEAGLKKKTLAVSEFLDWWEKNKEDLKE